MCVAKSQKNSHLSVTYLVPGTKYSYLAKTLRKTRILKVKVVDDASTTLRLENFSPHQYLPVQQQLTTTTSTDAWRLTVTVHIEP
jgi:hypothetical protein